MKIEVTEAIEIVGYAVGSEAANTLTRHFLKYQDWNRVKDIMTKELIRRNSEHIRLQKAYEKLTAQLPQGTQNHLP